MKEPKAGGKGKKNKLNERQGAKKTVGEKKDVFHMRAQENAEMGDEKREKLDK